MTDLIVTKDPQDINIIKEYLQDFDLIALDTETTGTSKTDEIIGVSFCAEESKGIYVILSEWVQDKLVYYPENISLIKDVLKSLVNKKLIMHNAIFDCIMIESYLKISLINSVYCDTMVLAHLLDENRPKGLKELGVYFFGEDADKEKKEMIESIQKNGGSTTKSKYELYKADSELIGNYGAKDAILTLKLYNKLYPQLKTENLYEFFNEESMPLLRNVTYDLNNTGFKIDVNAMTSLKKQLEAECAEAKSFIYKEIEPYIKEAYPDTNKKNKFNIGSSSQLSWLIFGQYELEFSTLTKEGKTVCKHLIGKLPYKISDKNRFIKECLERKGEVYAVSKGKDKKIKDPWSYIACDKTTLKKLSSKYKWIEKLLEYQRKTKLLSTYIDGMTERMNYGVIYPSFNQCGTTSGRYSSTNPNFQNLPRDDQRIKECIIPRPGNVFVGADYSQLEPRVFSYMSQDENLIKVFNGSEDFYSAIGMRVYGKTDCTPQKEGSPDAFGIKYKKLRDLSKVIALASVYGATANQLSSTTGKSIEETQDDIDNYFEQFPGVKNFMLESHEQAKKQGFVSNIFGRKRRMTEAKNINLMYGKLSHKELPYDARSLLNLSTNHRVQSTAASIVNRSAIKFVEFCRQADIKAKIVAQVHDELVVECKEEDAENVSILLQEAMETTITLPGVPLEAIPRVTKNFAK